MHKVLAASLTVLSLTVPAAAQAQMGGMGHGNPKHEFGVDLAAVYAKPSGGSGTFSIFTPVDVRVGFVSAGAIQPELRLNFNFASGGGTFIQFDPGLNLLWKMGSATNMHGPYLTAGADVNIISSHPSGLTTTSGVIATVNGGIGTRIPYGSAATRLEGFVGYSFKSTKLGVPNTLSIGARIGLSLWH